MSSLRLLRGVMPASVLFCALFPLTAAFGQTVPRPNKVVHIMLENSTYGAIIGQPDIRTGTPYINSLLPIAANMTHSVGLTHPTDPNYQYFFTGTNQGITGNTDPRLPSGAQMTTPNLARNLINVGYSFVNYAQNLGYTGNPTYFINGPDGQHFMEENVAGYWIGTGKNQIPASCMQPLENLPTDYNQLPTVSFWHPVEDHDMHQGFPNEKHNDGDNWVRNIVANYVQWAMKNNSVLIISWDESYTANEDPALYNHIPTLIVGPMVRPGDYSQPIDHRNVLRTICDMYAISRPGGAATATPITSIWKASLTETPIVSLDGPVNFVNREAPANITLTASVVPNGHTIAKVQFYNGSTLLGEATSAPYTYAWNSVPASSHGYSLSAKVVYDGANVTSSAPVTCYVWPASQPVTTGLVAYLGFDGSLNGGGGTSLNGTAFPVGRTPHYVTGKLGQAADFLNTGTGTANDWAVSLGNLDATYAGDFTYSFWVKTSSTSDSAVMGNKNWAAGGNTGWVVTTHPSAKTFNWLAANTAPVVTGNRHDVGVFPRISDGGWHLISQSFDRANNRVCCYMDGKPYNVSTISSNSGSLSLGAGFNTLIGSSGPGTYASTSSVDDVAVWSRVLNPNEIAAIYANGQAGLTLLGTTPPPPPPPPLITDSLQAYLKFDGDLAAASGTSVAGTVFSGTAHYAAGKFGQAVSFSNNASTSQSSDWAVSLGSLETVYAGDFSFSLWIKSSSTLDAALFGNKNWNSGSNVGFVVATTGNKNVNWNTTGGTRRDVGVSGLTNGSWHLLSVTWNRTSNQVITYLDGVSVSSSTIGTTGAASLNASLNTLVGSSGSGTSSGTGDVDDVAVWSRVLSASEIAGIYSRGQSGQPLIP